MAEVLQHSATAQFAGIPGAGAGDVDRGLADCALPFELQFADKAGRRACQGDPAGVACCGHDLDNRAALLPIPMRSSKGRPEQGVRTRDHSILPHSDHSGSTESKSETFGAHHAAVYSLSDWYKISGRSPALRFG